jgi:diacylglycerol kinase (ATP)
MIVNDKKFSLADRASSFRFAFAGIASFVRSEHNAWIHLAAGAGAIILGWIIKISAAEWIAIIICMAMVISAEIINTAIEKTMDHLSPARHPAVKTIKDLAAAAVLVTALAAFVIALIIFIPKVI